MSLTQKIGQVITLSTLIFGSFIPTAFSATVPQENVQETKSETLLAQATTETRRMRYQIQNCNRTGQEVVCGVLITNITNKSRDFSLFMRDGRAIDFSGNIYPLSKIALGNRYITRRSIRAGITPGIPTKANFYFAIPQRVNRLAGIEFVTGWEGKIGLRNIPIGNYRRVRGRHNCR